VRKKKTQERPAASQWWEKNAVQKPGGFRPRVLLFDYVGNTEEDYPLDLDKIGGENLPE